MSQVATTGALEALGRSALYVIVLDITYKTPRQFSTEPIDKTAYGDYTAIKQLLRRFLDEVYMLQQHPFYTSLAHSSQV
jgi:hypothetical protein